MPVGIPNLNVCMDYAMIARDQLQWLLAHLEFPDRAVYWAAAQAAYRDTMVASSSLLTLGYLTTRPLWRLLYWISGHLWTIVKFLSKHLLSQVYTSTIKGYHQAKWIGTRYWHWQVSLSRKALIIEGSLVMTLAILYVLRKYIQKKKYYERSVSWYKAKKRGIVKSYHSFLRKVSHTSLLLAMLLPHVLFLGVCSAIKLLFPRVVTYFATETYLSSILGTWYPLIWTISLLYHYRHGASNVKTRDGTKKTNVMNKAAPSTPLKQIPQTPAKSPTTPGFYPKTTPMKHMSTPVQRWLRAAATPSRHGGNHEIQEECTYWLHYWMVLATLSTISSLLYSTPFMGRLLTRNIWVKSSLLELQLVFFLWIFGLPASLTSASIDPKKGYESRPLPIVYNNLTPTVLTLYNTISNAVPESFWNTFCEKAKSCLSLCVMLRILSEDTKEHLHHVLVEARPLLAPAMTLFTPFTGIGVVYVKSVVPAAKHMSCLSVSDQMASLEFWVLHTMLSGLVQWWSGVLWWIPFSSHVIFLLWAYVQIPKSCRKYYNILEEELQAFGLLEKGEKELDVQRSLTARLVTRWIQSLPSASTSDDDIPSDDNSKNQTASDDMLPENERGNFTNDKESEKSCPTNPQHDDGSNLMMVDDDDKEENHLEDMKVDDDEDYVPTPVKVEPLLIRRSSRLQKGEKTRL